MSTTGRLPFAGPHALLALLLGTALGLSACASLDGPAAPAAPSAAAAATAASSPEALADRSRVPQLEVDAPEPLKTLLGTYLDLARTIRLPQAGEVSPGEWARLMAAAPQQAAELARTEGFFNTRAEVLGEDEPGDSPPRIRLKVDAGPQVRVGKLTLELQGELSELAELSDSEVGASDTQRTLRTEARKLREQIQAQWPLTTDRPFSGERWDEAKNGVLAQLRAAGYAAASWSGTAAQIDPATQRARIFVVADSGPLYRAGEISVSGLSHHSAERVRGLAGFEPGDALTEARVQEYQERLAKAGLFDQVTVSFDPEPASAAAAPVQVRVVETPLQSATTSVGYSANAGPRAGVEHVHRQIFGQALTLRSKLEWGRDKQAGDFELSTHPDQEMGRNVYGVSGERTLTSSDMVLSQQLKVGRSLERPKVERFNFLQALRTKECARDGDHFSNCDELAALSANTNSTWRRVDNVLLPTEGYTLNTQLGAGVADGTASQRGLFGRAYARAIGYLPVGGWYTLGRLELGKVLTAPGVQVPDTLRFRAGGDNSVRGYAWRTLAPTNSDGTITGGRMLVTASVEAAHPLVASLPSVWGALFLDAGRAADHVSALSPALGYGVGVRWRSPVGPLSLDWAWGEEVHRGRLHLNVGVAF